MTPEEKAARDIVCARSGGVCEGCGARRAREWSHRIGRGVGGPWAAENGLHLCPECHRYIGLEPTLARVERGWRLESTDDPAQVPALHWLHGWVLLTADGSFVPTDVRP